MVDRMQYDVSAYISMNAQGSWGRAECMDSGEMVESGEKSVVRGVEANRDDDMWRGTPQRRTERL